MECVGGCGFFGNAALENLCSACHKLKYPPKEKEVVIPPSKVVPLETPKPISETVVESEKKEKETRCWTCKKKLSLTDISCRCGHFFCSLHRYSDKHACDFDYKSQQKSQLSKANPLVSAEKLEKI
jgi:hypothetical protein